MAVLPKHGSFVKPTVWPMTFGLRSIKLWNCPYSLVILGRIVNRTESSTLKTFELAIDSSCLGSQAGISGAEEQGKIVEFLQDFCGLEDLFLMLPPLTDWDGVEAGMLNHRLTLQRLVVHN
jgi:hypothetical protein